MEVVDERDDAVFPGAPSRAPPRAPVHLKTTDRPGRNKVNGLFSRAFAEKQAGGIDGIVGRDIRLDAQPYRVVGILLDTFTFLSP